MGKKTTKTSSKTHETSVVAITAYGKAYNYAQSWQGPYQTSWTGSGFVMNFDGKPRLLTNAHCAADASTIEVRVSNDDKRYLARVKVLDNQCDLAMLEVEDPEFWNIVKPLELGSMVDLREKVQVIGFPMSGEEVCITDGRVSRIETNVYCQGGTELLTAQVTAPINPGNSGGCVIKPKTNQVTGVAFQVNPFGDGIGFMIPAPVIEHFIKEATQKERYAGFPDVAFEYQNLTSSALRRRHHLSEEQSGVRVQSVDPLSTAYGLLKQNDIILKIDDNVIRNDGTVDTPFSARIKLAHLFREKFIGDNITFHILRDGKPLSVEVPLLNRCHSTKLLQQETDKQPTYYIHSGIVFVPATTNLYEDDASIEDSTAKRCKNRPGEQMVLIQDVLHSAKTRGLDDLVEEQVKSINGVKIHNIRDVIKAMEGNKDSIHVFLTTDGTEYVAPNLTKAENKSILDDFSCTSDRSKDLRRKETPDPGCPEHTKMVAPMFYKERKALVKAFKKEEEKEAKETKRKKKASVH